MLFDLANKYIMIAFANWNVYVSMYKYSPIVVDGQLAVDKFNNAPQEGDSYSEWVNWISAAACCQYQ